MVALGLTLLVLNALLIHTHVLYWVGLVLTIVGVLANLGLLGGRTCRVY